MGTSSKSFDIFEGPDSDGERAKPLNTKVKGRSTRRKQTTPLTRTKRARAYESSSQQIVEQTQSKQKVRSGRKQKQSAETTNKSRGEERIKPRRSTRLEAQKFKDAMRTENNL